MTELKEKIKAAQIDLIKELGIDKLEPEKKEEIILQIGEILQQRVVMRVIEELADDKQDEFKEVLDKASENPQLVDEFLEKNVPGLQDMILEEIGEYKKGAVDFMKEALKDKTEENKDLDTEVIEDEPKEVIEPVQSQEEVSSNEVIEENLEKIETEEKPEIEEIPTSQNTENQNSISGIEQEKNDQEAQILEENKVDNEVVEGEELDLTEEVSKMKSEE